MNLTFECPNCHSPSRAEFFAGREIIVCPHCSGETRQRSDAVDGAKILACSLCGTEDMYVQKDFPHRVGLTIVGLGILFSSLAWWRYWYPSALAILLITAALDLCLYYWIGDVLVCYRCLAQYRGTQRNPSHQPFDLGIGERYRQERIRLEMLRRSSTNSGTGSVSDQEQGPP